MRILFVGAGAIGGYYGGRLLQAGRDVTFLVREGRAAQLAGDGLNVISPFGDIHIASPATVTRDTIPGPYDVVLLSCKAYSLDSAMDDMAAAIGPDTVIIPALNGMAHIDKLIARFGARSVLGGICMIPAMLEADGTIRQLARMHGMTFGELDGGTSARVEAIGKVFGDAGFDSSVSLDITQALWEKWVFLASTGASTCLMRGTVGQILSTEGGHGYLSAMIEEAVSVAAAHGHPPGDAAMQRGRAVISEVGSPMTTSMFRDMAAGGAIEADHIIGDMLARGRAKGLSLPLLDLAYRHLKTYEARRAKA